MVHTHHGPRSSKLQSNGPLETLLQRPLELCQQKLARKVALSCFGALQDLLGNGTRGRKGMYFRVGTLCLKSSLRRNHQLSNMDHRLYSGYCVMGEFYRGNQTNGFLMNIEVKKESNGSGNEGSSSTCSDIITMCKLGRLKDALFILLHMDDRCIQANINMYASLLQECTNMKALEEGKQVHAHIVKSNFKLKLVIENALVNMYCKCASMVDACEMFDKMLERDVFTWTTMITGYAKHGPADKAFKLFQQMQGENVKPDEVTFLSLLNACASIGALEQGKQIHAHIKQSGINPNMFMRSTLVDMYCKCGNIVCARQEFDRMPQRDVISWNALSAGYVQHGHSLEALNLFVQMVDEGLKPDEVTFLSVFKACSSLQVLEHAKKIHEHTVINGIECDVFVGSTLVDTYAKCGSIEDARQVFDKMPKRTVVSWNAMITGYAQPGCAESSLKLFQQMELAGVKPTVVTFVGVLKACTILGVLEQGKQIHEIFIKSGMKLNVIIGNTLVDMYAKCGSIEAAHHTFDKIPERDVISWNALIAGYAQHGFAYEAFKLFRKMEREGKMPDRVTYLNVLKACDNLEFLERGRQIHSFIMQNRYESDIFIGSTLLDMYAKCGSVDDAREMFDKMLKRNVVAWNAMIAGYVQHELFHEAFKLFQDMQEADTKPVKVTFLNIIKACSSLGVLEEGKHIHSYIINCGFESDMFLGNSLVDMYAKCGSVNDAWHVFDRLHEKNVVSWNALIAGYVQQEHYETTFELMGKMEQENVRPNEVTFITALKACANLARLDQGKQMHAFIERTGLESDLFVGNSLIDMYAKCKSLDDACRVFKRMPEHDVVTWNAMIVGYSQPGHCEEALKLFWQMECHGVKPDEVTFLNMVKVCTSLGTLEQGMEIHACIFKNGFELNSFLGNALIDMYAKCGSFEDAYRVFEHVPERGVVAWNAMLTGYIQHGHAEEAFNTFLAMEQEGVEPDRISFLNILKAFGSLGFLEQGKKIHSHIQTSRFESDLFVNNTLIDMYGKCGSVDVAQQVFDQMKERDVISWNALMTGYAQNGHVHETFELFHKMQSEGQKLDHVTFVSVLSVCNHAGLVDEGRCYFYYLSKEHGIARTNEHYACMVDILGRAGCLEEAVQLVEKMPFQPSSVVWMTLLGGCRHFGNLELAKRAAETVFELEPQNAAAYVLLSNAYAVEG